MFQLPELFGSPYVLPAIIAVVVLLLVLLLLSIRRRRRDGAGTKIAKSTKAMRTPAPAASLITTEGRKSDEVMKIADRAPHAAMGPHVRLESGSTATARTPSTDPVASVVSSILQGWGDLTSEDINRLKLFRPERIVAAIAAAGSSKDLKGSEYASSRLSQLRQYASSLQNSRAADQVSQATPSNGQPGPETEPEPAKLPVTEANASVETSSDLDSGDDKISADAAGAIDAANAVDAIDAIEVAQTAAEIASDKVFKDEIPTQEIFEEKDDLKEEIIEEQIIEEEAVEEEVVEEDLDAFDNTIAEDIIAEEELPFAEDLPSEDKTLEFEQPSELDQIPEKAGISNSIEFIPGPRGIITTAEQLLALPATEQAGMVVFLQPAELGKVFRATTDSQLKKSAIDTLEHIGSTNSLDVLRECLDDPDPAIQVYAADAADRLLGTD